MSEIYVDKHGRAHDDEGHSWDAPGMSRGVYGRRKAGRASSRKEDPRRRAMLDALYLALYHRPDDEVLSSAAEKIYRNKQLDDRHMGKIRKLMIGAGMKKEAKLFEDNGLLGGILERIEAYLVSEARIRESYMGRGTHIRSDIEEKFPKLYAKWLKKHKEATDAEKKFFAGKGREYFEMANRLYAEAYGIYNDMKKKAGW